MGIIELWGLPGAGKSTICRTIQERGVVSASTICATNCSPRGRILRLAHRLRSDAHARRAIADRRWQQECAARNVGGNVSVFDEGVVHEVWRQLYRDPGLVTRNWWVRELERASNPIVVIHVSPSVALSRIASKPDRGPINQQLLAAGEINRPEWTNAIAGYVAIFAVLRRLGATVIEADVTPLGQVVSEVERVSREQAARPLSLTSGHLRRQLATPRNRHLQTSL